MTTTFVRTLKTTVACASLALAGVAMAQGTPPNPNVSNPALGAGQQSQNGTPMGTTGVLPQAGGTSGGASSSASPAPMAAPAPANTMSSDTSADRPMRRARADRN